MLPQLELASPAEPASPTPSPEAPSNLPGSPPQEGEPGSESARPALLDDATVVALRAASCDFGEGSGVFDLDLSIRRGALLGIVGPSGSGKTTTVRLITGGLEPTAGEVRVLDEDPRHFRRATRERIGYMPQRFTLYTDLTADENVDFVASLFGMLMPRRRRRVREVLQFVELWDVRARRAGRLSGGMQRRLELACALVHQPDLLLLDEPTAGLDPILRARIWEELGRLRDLGRTIVVTTQYVTEAESCDSVALVDRGRLVALGAPEGLRRQAAGGDVIEVETEAPFDPAGLVGRDGIRSAESVGLRRFRLVAADAGTLTPVLDNIVARAGGRLSSAREVHLTFDEVFVALVEGARPPAAASDDRAGRPSA